MDEPTSSTLIERLERLEREVRWWRLGAVVAGGLLGLVALVGATKPPVADEVRAKRFVLVDEAGREHARLGMGLVGVVEPHLEPELCLGDKEKSGTCVYPYGLSTRASNNGFVNLNPIGLRMALGNVEVEINTGLGSAGPRLKLSGASPTLVLADERGRDRAVLGDTSVQALTTRAIEWRPASSLVLFDKDGKVIWKAP
jgi:hypothetical protein